MVIAELFGTSSRLERRSSLYQSAADEWLLRPLALIATSILFALALVAALSAHQAFDHAVLHLLNRPARHSWALDATIYNLDRPMFSILPIMAMVWFVWFKSEETGRRAVILSGVMLSIAVGGVSRCLQLVLHTHPRPDVDPTLHFRVPYLVVPGVLNRWSSFPSDHVAVWFELATIVFVMHRRLGRWAYGIAVAASAGRVYTGIHCPTDALGAAMLGILTAALAVRLGSSGFAHRLVRTSRTNKPLFYAICLYVCFGVTTLFDDYRDVASDWAAVASHAAHTMEHHHGIGAGGSNQARRDG